MNIWKKGIKRFTESPYVLLVISLILLVTSLMEAWETLAEDISELDFKGHHGLAIFAFFNVLRVLPELFKGIVYLEEAKEQNSESSDETN